MTINAKNKNRIVLHLLLSIILPAAFLFMLEMISPYYFLWDDNATYFLPAYSHNWISLIQNKTVPLINLHQSLGTAHFAQGQPAVFYPLVYLSVFLSRIFTSDFIFTIDIVVILHLILASCGMFLLQREIRIKPILCLGGSLIFITFPFIIFVSRCWAGVSYTAAILPFNFLLLLKLLKKPDTRNALLLALIKVLFFYTGFVQWLLVTFIFEIIITGIYLLTQNQKDDCDAIESGFEESDATLLGKPPILKRIMFYIISNIYLFFLSAPVLLPAFVYQNNSNFRAEKISYNEFIYNIMKFYDFITSQFFIFRDLAIFQSSTQIFHAGLILIIVIIAGLPITKLIRDFRNKFLLFGIPALTAFLISGVIYSILYYLPIFNKMRWGFKNYLFFLFFITPLSMLCLQYITEKMKPALSKILTLLIPLIIIISNLTAISFNTDNKFASYRISPEYKKEISKYPIDNTGRVFTLYISDVYKTDLWKYQTFNLASLYGNYHFGGYDVLVSRLNHKLTFGLNHKNIFKDELTSGTLNYLSFFSAKYFISSNSEFNEEYFLKIPQMKKIYEDESILINENTAAAPFVYYIKDKLPVTDKNFFSNFSSIQKFPLNYSLKTNSIEIERKETPAQRIFLSIAPLKGYQIYFDGKKTGTLEAAQIPVFIDVPDGIRNISIKYTSPYYNIGCAILITFLIINILIWLIKILNKKHKTEPISGNQ